MSLLHPSTPHSQRFDSATVFAITSIAVILLCRFWLAIDFPLTDTTEARYGEMARKMVETGDWLVPQHDYGIPYLAKPPLAIWLSAVGIRLFGASELGPRILIFVAAIAFLVYLYRWIQIEIGFRTAWFGILVLMGSLLFFVSMAAVMTDLVLVICVDTGLLALWSRLHGKAGRGSEWLFFGMAGLGLLAKGPIALFLMGAPILMWAAVYGRLGDLWQRISWIRGTLLTLVIALPWYLAAERSHPGFLRYFLIGEHIQRFLVSDWQGDLYGPVHELPHGTIWLFLIIGALPWSVLCAVSLYRSRLSVIARLRGRCEIGAYFLFAALTPLILFTLAQNVILPYALPVIVPVLIAGLAIMGEETMTFRLIRVASLLSGGTAVAFLLGATLLNDQVESESERAVVAALRSAEPGGTKLYYWGRRYYSADYYSEGRAIVLSNLSDLRPISKLGQSFGLVMEEALFNDLPRDIQDSLHKIGEYSKNALYGPATDNSPVSETVGRR